MGINVHQAFKTTVNIRKQIEKKQQTQIKLFKVTLHNSSIAKPLIVLGSLRIPPMSATGEILISEDIVQLLKNVKGLSIHIADSFYVEYDVYKTLLEQSGSTIIVANPTVIDSLKNFSEKSGITISPEVQSYIDDLVKDFQPVDYYDVFEAFIQDVKDNDITDKDITFPMLTKDMAPEDMKQRMYLFLQELINKELLSFAEEDEEELVENVEEIEEVKEGEKTEQIEKVQENNSVMKGGEKISENIHIKEKENASIIEEKKIKDKKQYLPDEPIETVESKDNVSLTEETPPKKRKRGRPRKKNKKTT